MNIFKTLTNYPLPKKCIKQTKQLHPHPHKKETTPKKDKRKEKAEKNRWQLTRNVTRTQMLDKFRYQNYKNMYVFFSTIFIQASIILETY